MKALKSQRAKQLLSQPQFVEELRRVRLGRPGSDGVRLELKDDQGRPFIVRVESVAKAD